MTETTPTDPTPAEQEPGSEKDPNGMARPEPEAGGESSSSGSEAGGESSSSGSEDDGEES